MTHAFCNQMYSEVLRHANVNLLFLMLDSNQFSAANVLKYIQTVLVAWILDVIADLAIML